MSLSLSPIVSPKLIEIDDFMQCLAVRSCLCTMHRSFRSVIARDRSTVRHSFGVTQSYLEVSSRSVAVVHLTCGTTTHSASAGFIWTASYVIAVSTLTWTSMS